MIKCVVPLSGGKDSQACLKIALTRFKKSEILGLFCDTKFEHPKTYEHIKFISKYYDIKVKTINAGNVIDKVLRYKMFPVGGARFCTDELKIIPSKKYYKELAELQGGFVVYYGMRFDESKEREKRYHGKLDEELYMPHEVLSKYPKYLGKLGVRFQLPILSWSESEVIGFLDGKQNPLYLDGFDRVGCFPCLASGDKNKIKAFNYDDFGLMQKVVINIIEGQIGKSVFTSNKEQFNQKQIGMFDDVCSICKM